MKVHFFLFQVTFLGLILGFCSCHSRDRSHLTTAELELCDGNFPACGPFAFDALVDRWQEWHPDWKIEKSGKPGLLTVKIAHSLDGTGRKLVASALDSHAEKFRRLAVGRLDTLSAEIHRQTDFISELRRDSLLLSTVSGMTNEAIKATPNQIKRRARLKLAEMQIEIDQREAQLQQIHSSEGDRRLAKASEIEEQNQSLSFYVQIGREAKRKMQILIEKGMPTDHPEVLALTKRSKSALDQAHLEADAVEERLETILDLRQRRCEQLEDLILLLIEDRHGIASRSVVDLFQKRLQELREAQDALGTLEAEAKFLRGHLEASRPFIVIRSLNQE